MNLLCGGNPELQMYQGTPDYHRQRWERSGRSRANHPQISPRGVRGQCFASVTASHGDHRDPSRRCTPQMYKQHSATVAQQRRCLWPWPSTGSFCRWVLVAFFSLDPVQGGSNITALGAKNLPRGRLDGGSVGDELQPELTKPERSEY